MAASSANVRKDLVHRRPYALDDEELNRLRKAIEGDVFNSQDGTLFKLFKTYIEAGASVCPQFAAYILNGLDQDAGLRTADRPDSSTGLLLTERCGTQQEAAAPHQPSVEDYLATPAESQTDHSPFADQEPPEPLLFEYEALSDLAHVFSELQQSWDRAAPFVAWLRQAPRLGPPKGD